VQFNASYPSPYTIEYKWRGTKDENRPLGVKTLFLLAIVLLIGIISVVYTTYERDALQVRKAPGSGSSSYTGGGAGIHVKRRPSGGNGFDKRTKY
jgi:hypothetical protein